jgi:hypothetical protein
MNRYQPSAPRAAFGIAAVAMTAVTLALAVVAPVKLSPGPQGTDTVVAAKAVAPAHTEVLIVPARIDVIGARESTVAGDAPVSLPAKRKQQG